MQDLTGNSTWTLIKNRLEDRLQHAKDGLTNLNNTREEDLTYKAKIAVIKELLNLPRELEALAANNKR